MLGADSPLLNVLGIAPAGDLGPLTGYTSKRGRPVWYLKAPPKTPPTGPQLHQRHLFRLIANTWRSLTDDQRAAWLAAAQGAHLKITGYNLFVWYQLRKDGAVIATIEHQSGINLI